MAENLFFRVFRLARRGLAALAVSTAVVGPAPPAWADGGRIDDYLAYQRNQGGETRSYSQLDAMMIRLIGAYEAIGWVNVLYLQESKPPVFCPPDNFTISTAYLQEMLDAEIRDHTYSQSPYPGDLPMDAVVMFASRARFPCP